MTMDTASVDNHRQHRNHPNPLRIESLPLVDLRLLSQSELLSLSLYSPAAPPSSFAAASAAASDDDDVSTPKIDRSVFNESAGSRKQTFYRLRLAPPRGNPSAAVDPSLNASLLPPTTQEIYVSDAENTQIVSLLKSLFAIESIQEDDKDEQLVPVNIEFTDYLHFPAGGNVDLARSAVSIVDNNVSGYSDRKRKRGRPRKDETLFSNSFVNNYYGSSSGIGDISNSVGVGVGYSVDFSDSLGRSDSVDTASGSGGKRRPGRPRRSEGRLSVNNVNDKVILEVKEENKEEFALVNNSGASLDLATLVKAEDLFEVEIRRRTTGLDTEEKLLGYMSGLNGEWASIRKKRRIVNASILVDALPKGWKLMLAIKRNAGYVWLVCRRFISPNGQQFVSCKEVANYLLSFHQSHEASQPSSNNVSESIQLHNKSTSVNAAVVLQNDKIGADPVNSSSVPVTTSISSGSETQDSLPYLGMPGNAQRGNVLKCHKCPMTFGVADEFLHHLIYSHQKAAKKVKDSGSEAMIMKDGKYECQLCQKLFEEKHRYYGHLGIHMKMYAKRKETKSSGLAPGHVLPRVLEMPAGTDKASVGNTFPDIKTASTFSNPDERLPMKTDTGDCSNCSNDKVEQVTTVTDDTAANTNVCFGPMETENKSDANVKLAIGVTDNAAANANACLGAMESGKEGNDNVEQVTIITGKTAANIGLEAMDTDNTAANAKVGSSAILIENEGSYNLEQVTGGTDDGAANANVCGNKNIDQCKPSGVDERRIRPDDMLSYAKENNSEGCSGHLSGNEQRRCSLADMTGDVNVQERGSDELPQAIADQACATRNNSRHTCPSMMVIDKYEEMDKYRNDEQPVNLVDSEQLVSRKSNVTKLSPRRTMELPKINQIRNSNKSAHTLEIHETCISTGLATSFDQGRIFNDSLQSGMQLRTLKKDTVSNSVTEHLENDKGSKSSLIRPSGNERSFNVHNNAKESYQQIQSSDHFQGFDIIMNKGEGELFGMVDKYDNASSFDGLRSENSEQMEYNFFDEQTNAYSEDSKVFSYDTEMAMGFDSNAWIEKEALHMLPKTSNTHPVVAVCVWCGNQIYQDTYEAGQQTEAIGYICASCKAKLTN